MRFAKTAILGALSLTCLLQLSACVTVPPMYPMRGSVAVTVDIACEGAQSEIKWGALKLERSPCRYSPDVRYDAALGESFPSEPLMLSWRDADGLLRHERVDVTPKLKEGDFYVPGTRLTVAVKEGRLTASVHEISRETLWSALWATCHGSQFAASHYCEKEERNAVLLTRPIAGGTRSR